MRKLSGIFEKMMTAVSFAEAGEFETAQHIMREGQPEQISGAETLSREIPASGSVSRAMQAPAEITEHDRTMEAITFAEAGEHSYAKELVTADETGRKRILVVGGEEGYSDILMNYAIVMAERMDYEIVALSVITVGSRLFSLLTDNVREEMRNRATSEAETFRIKASEKNIPFVHSVKFGTMEKEMKSVHREIRRIAFIMTEPEHVPGSEKSPAGIPVFCLAE